MNAIKNPSTPSIIAMIKGSRERAARKITDPRNGDEWFWPAEQGTHAEGAEFLGVPYNRPPGDGDIVTL